MIGDAPRFRESHAVALHLGTEVGPGDYFDGRSSFGVATAPTTHGGSTWARAARGGASPFDAPLRVRDSRAASSTQAPLIRDDDGDVGEGDTGYLAKSVVPLSKRREVAPFSTTAPRLRSKNLVSLMGPGRYFGTTRSGDLSQNDSVHHSVARARRMGLLEFERFAGRIADSPGPGSYGDVERELEKARRVRRKPFIPGVTVDKGEDASKPLPPLAGGEELTPDEERLYSVKLPPPFSSVQPSPTSVVPGPGSHNTHTLVVAFNDRRRVTRGGGGGGRRSSVVVGLGAVDPVQVGLKNSGAAVAQAASARKLNETMRARRASTVVKCFGTAPRDDLVAQMHRVGLAAPADATPGPAGYTVATTPWMTRTANVRVRNAMEWRAKQAVKAPGGTSALPSPTRSLSAPVLDGVGVTDPSMCLGDFLKLPPPCPVPWLATLPRVTSTATAAAAGAPGSPSRSESAGEWDVSAAYSRRHAAPQAD